MHQARRVAFAITGHPHMPANTKVAWMVVAEMSWLVRNYLFATSLPSGPHSDDPEIRRVALILLANVPPDMRREDVEEALEIMAEIVASFWHPGDLSV
jgi:hypothetical protein